jgi:23S rRNA (uracil1939-C5)-methyltransferase
MKQQFRSGSGRNNRRGAPKPAQVTAELTLGPLGSEGDARAELDGKRLHIAFGLPGERVRAGIANGRGEVDDVLEASPDRVTPPCPHFGVCGGCALQHASPEAMARFKRDRVVEALNRAGVEANVGQTLSAWGDAASGRQRAVFQADVRKGAVVLGFAGRRSHQIVDQITCPILTPEIERARHALRAISAQLGADVGAMRLAVTASETGLDVAITTERSPHMRYQDHEALADLARKADLARLSLNGVPVIEARAPVTRAGQARVIVPPGAFLQATMQAETALTGFAAAALEGVEGPVADLFCGWGAFALRLATDHPVYAADGDAPAIAALAAAARTAPLKPIDARVRDLFANPVEGGELKRFAGVVIDPPRAGAEAQMRALAAHGPGRVVSISCNPVSFARDAAILIAGGYRIGEVLPLDQFRYSPHVEVMAVFER